jgi:LCP family protein required for cell wall assembly
MNTTVDDSVSEPVSEPVPAGRERSPAIAAGLSFLWPGLGQLFLGRRRAAAALAVPALLIAIVAAIQLGQGALWFAASLWDQTYFQVVAFAVVAFGVWRIVAVGHAFLSASAKRRPRRIELGFVGALVALILVMHGLFVAGAWAWYDTSVSIQNNDIFADPSTTPTAPSGTLGPTPVDTSSFVPFGITPSGSPTPTRPPNPNRITFLLIGSDFMTGRTHSLTDTLMLVSIDMSTEKVSFVSVPRDTSNFDLYYGGWVGPTFKINTLLNSAGTKYLRSPDPPMKTLENEIGFLVGVPVNYYAALDLNGFARMVDALGGIDIVNQRAINDPSTGIVMAPGPVHLDGATAMLYVRSRENGGSDYLRAARQQALLVALEHKVVSPAGLGQLGTLLSLAGKTIGTDFPLNTARNYVSAAQRVSSIESCVLGPPYSYHPDTSTTDGTWTSRLDMARVANLSVEMFGKDSRYYGQPGVVPAACGK